MWLACARQTSVSLDAKSQQGFLDAALPSGSERRRAVEAYFAAQCNKENLFAGSMPAHSVQCLQPSRCESIDHSSLWSV